MSARARSRGGRRWWIAAVLLLGAGLLVRQLHPGRVDETVRCGELVASLDRWAAEQWLRVREGGAAAAEHVDDGARWTVSRRDWWHRPHRSARTLRARLETWAARNGVRCAATTSADGTLEARLALPDGRPLADVSSRRMFVVALVIDDMGFNLATTRRVVALPCRLTCAIIPFTVHAREVAALAAAHGKEVWVHMPMSSPFKVPAVPEYSVMLRPGMTAADVHEDFDKAFASVPNAVGVNNHEGSVATADRPLMDLVMQDLKARHVFFLDSGTTEATVAWAAARDAGVPYSRRTVFIDPDHNSYAMINQMFDLLLTRAKSRGSAIGIAHHQYPKTLDVLEQRIPQAMQAGVEFVFARTLPRPAGKGP